MSNLIGGIQYVTLSDEEAKRRGTQKSVLERKTYPAFEIVIELNEQNSWTIHEDVKASVDLILRGDLLIQQVRQFSITENIEIKTKYVPSSYGSFLKDRTDLSSKNWDSINSINKEVALKFDSKILIIYSYSLSNNLFKEVFSKLNFKFILTNEIYNASLIIGLKKHLKQNCKLKSLAHEKNIPIYALDKVSIFEMRKLIQYLNKN